MNCLRALALMLVATVVLPAAALAESTPTSTPSTGGAAFAPAGSVRMVVPGRVAKLLPDGSAAAPADAPRRVRRAIYAGNRLQEKPYLYGGGHASFKSSGYDCSGTVSFALHGAGLLDSPLDSSRFMSWGEPGRGRWITVYTNPGHAYVVIAGLRLDTSSYGVTSRRGVARSAFERGPRWRPTRRPSTGFQARHPVGF